MEHQDRQYLGRGKVSFCSILIISQNTMHHANQLAHAPCGICKSSRPILYSLRLHNQHTFASYISPNNRFITNITRKASCLAVSSKITHAVNHYLSFAFTVKYYSIVFPSYFSKPTFSLCNSLPMSLNCVIFLLSKNCQYFCFLVLPKMVINFVPMGPG